MLTLFCVEIPQDFGRPGSTTRAGIEFRIVSGDSADF